jgi:hypothetical protein
LGRARSSEAQHDPEGVVRGKGVIAGPWKRVDILEVGEVLAVLPVERRQDSREVDEEWVAARAGKEGMSAGRDWRRLHSEGHLGIADDRTPDGLALTSFRPGCHVDGRPLPAVLGTAEDHAEGDVGLSVSVVVDVDPVHGVRVEGIRYSERIRVENQHCSRRTRRRLEGKEIREIEAWILGRRSEPQACEMV